MLLCSWSKIRVALLTGKTRQKTNSANAGLISFSDGSNFIEPISQLKEDTSGMYTEELGTTGPSNPKEETFDLHQDMAPI